MNPERIIVARDQVQKALDAFSQVLEEELCRVPAEAPASSPRQPEARGGGQQQPAQVFDVWAIPWKQKDGEPAGQNPAWGWSFGYTFDGNPIPEIKDLVQYLEQYGSLEVKGYTVSLGGRDGNLLNLKKNTPKGGPGRRGA